jgi:cytochrome P450
MPDARRYPLGAGVTTAGLTTDPHPILASLRCAEPVSWLPALDGWLVTSHDLCTAVLRDPVTFTVDDPRFSTAQVVGASMLSLDGSEHGRHRAPFVRPFHPSAIRDRFTAFANEQAHLLLDRLRPRGSAELRREFAGPLSVAVMAEVLGLPGTKPATILAWYDEIVAAVTSITAGTAASDAAAEAMEQLRGAVEGCVHGDAPASLLVDAAQALTVPETVSNAAVLLFGGIETTEGMIANALLHLLGTPDRLAEARDDPGLVARVIEESLRLEPAAAVVDRYATADTLLGDVPISRGELVRVSLAGANRDPAIFTDPDAFEPSRANLRRQLAFAVGPHFCIGRDLARLEAEAAIRAVLAELPGLRLTAPAAPSGLVFRKPPALHTAWARA